MTDSVLNNSDLLTNISKCKDNNVLRIVSNGGGSVTYDTIGNFGLIPILVYYNKNSLANGFFFKQVTALKDVRITLNTLVKKAMIVSFCKIVLKFKECNDGLYYLNVSELVPHKNKSSVTPYFTFPSPSSFSFLNIVHNNKSLYTKN